MIVMEFLDFDDICYMAKLSEKFNKKIFDVDGKRILERLFDTELDEKEMKWDFLIALICFLVNFNKQWK